MPSLLALLCTGLFWADRFASGWEGEHQRRVAQAVLDEDLLTTLAYRVADHDRLHEPDIYAAVPVASTHVSVPTLRQAFVQWAPRLLVLGLLLFCVARIARDRSRPEGGARA